MTRFRVHCSICGKVSELVMVDNIGMPGDIRYCQTCRDRVFDAVKIAQALMEGHPKVYAEIVGIPYKPKKK